MATTPTIIIGDEQHGLTLPAVVAVARQGARVALAPAARERVAHSRTFVETLAASDRAIYGVTTGFGDLSRIRIAPEQLAALQRNLIRSHAAGVGDPLPRDQVRGMMVLLANSLARGHSGVRPAVIDLLLDVLNQDLTPTIPSRGSVGASGDLAPLAHLALALIGEGEVTLADGARLPSAAAFAQAGLAPLVLGAKEGLALINGTHLMEAMGALAIHDGWVLLRAGEAAAAQSLEALLGSQVPFDARIHALRPQPGQRQTAARVLKLLEGSEIIPSHANCGRVQDPYTIRCIPQVLGAVRDALGYCEGVFTTELRAVTDNPLIFDADEAVLTGGNFHGQPLALALDFMALAIAHLAAFAERRIYNLMGPHAWDENGAPPFLTPDPGLNSGYMIAQYVAAALVNEINTLAHPASTGSIPTSAGMEDYVSMGVTAGHKLTRMLDLATQVVSIELMCGAQGVDFRAPLLPGRGVQATHRAVRGIVPHLDADRPSAPDIAHLATALHDGLLDRALAEWDAPPGKHKARSTTSGGKRG
jgi:histidine ammonia-lyase